MNGKAGNLGGGVVTIERSKSKITVTSEVPFSKRYGGRWELPACIPAGRPLPSPRTGAAACCVGASVSFWGGAQDEEAVSEGMLLMAVKCSTSGSLKTFVFHRLKYFKQ